MKSDDIEVGSSVEFEMTGRIKMYFVLSLQQLAKGLCRTWSCRTFLDRVKKNGRCSINGPIWCLFEVFVASFPDCTGYWC